MLNRSLIMKRAWELAGKHGIDIGEALHRSWMVLKTRVENDRRIAEAKKVAGVTEEVNTWYGWKEAGFMVAHGSKALFGCPLIWASKGDGKIYNASFFGASQVEPLAVEG